MNKYFFKETLIDLVSGGVILALIAFIFITLSGCSASWHIKRAISKDPSILKADTITIKDTVEVYILEIQVKDSVIIKHDTLRVDSIISVATPLSWGSVQELRRKIYQQIQKDLEKDTAKLDTINYSIMAYYSGGKLMLDFNRQDSTIRKEFEVKVVDENVVYKKGFWDKVYQFSFWVLMVLIGSYLFRWVADKLLSK